VRERERDREQSTIIFKMCNGSDHTIPLGLGLGLELGLELELGLGLGLKLGLELG
jgi:hypothetical protein